LESLSAAEIRKKKVSSNRRGYLEELIVKINCETYYSSWAVDQEKGVGLESILRKRPDCKAAWNICLRH